MFSFFSISRLHLTLDENVHGIVTYQEQHAHQDDGHASDVDHDIDLVAGTGSASIPPTGDSGAVLYLLTGLLWYAPYCGYDTVSSLSRGSARSTDIIDTYE